ncbi:hypothetical protein [Altererythrobacter sp. TH136]|uniref:hypothetical protein n=1 Tax=Altererythrobacter sp. TH136 TaxID=2067415 RepID=UPI001163C5E3|nr:hypothetical protein [Altererythrobacter sp. TH136]QDM41015.1 hypothetical protein C0V74_08225 [Altererythrobacter sp. TH136]
MRRFLVLKSALVCGALAAAFVAGKESLALALADTQPQLALRLNPNQSDALSAAAHAAVSGAPSANLQLAGRQAAKALQIDPTNSRAAANVAVLRQLDGSETDAVEAMRYAQRLSRRNLAAQLWWIEYSAEQGDVERTLTHYDTAMRTARSAPSLLFPVLVTAVGNPIVSRRLAEVLAQRPSWAEQFVQQLAQSGRDLDAVHGLLSAMAASGAPVADPALRTALQRLVDDARYREALSLFAAYRPERAAAPVRNPTFRPISQGATIFDWQTGEGAEAAVLSPDGLLIEASSGTAKPAASQLVALPVGQHRFGLAYSALSDEGAAEPALSAHCASDGSLLGRSARTAEGQVRLEFSVPAGCVLQRLEIALPEADLDPSAGLLVTSIRKLR